jgi:2,4-dienoyl-CoA reductase-like NADH-dependent reductase (Old Yellow Enzyme family)/thioredoxin reductase
MHELKYKHLFEPIQIGKNLYRNRVFASPQDYALLTAEKFLPEEAAYFYERKALGGFASVCVGDMMVDSHYCSGRSHLFQMRGSDILGKVHLPRVSTAINRHGAIPAIELTSAGVNANVDLIPDFKGFVYGLTDGVRHDGVEVRAMNDEQIEDMIEAYANSAAIAKQCGFGMITVHGGHGWQIAQFISPTENKRTDKWGGSIENRMRFPLAVVDAIRRKIGNAIPIDFRMSASEYLPYGYDIDEGVKIAEMLDGKVDIIHVSAGHHEIDAAFMGSHPPMFRDDGPNVWYAAEIKRHVKTPVATVGALTNPDMMEDIIASGKADIIVCGRQTLADPDLPLKARTGRENEITPCIRCFHCFSSNITGGGFYCAVNPEIGREQASMTAIPAYSKKTVLVAGGGVGGMQAALTAAKRGHKVILCEKTDRLGGALLCEEKIPFKANLSKYLERQAQKVKNCKDIELHLNTEVTPEVARSFNPDVIIAALGARPMIPPIKGMDGKNVVGAEQVYYNPEIVGKSAVIMGGGLVGLELGIFLAQNGRKVTVVEMFPTTIASAPQAGAVSEALSGHTDVMPLGHPFFQGMAIREEMKKLPDMEIQVSTKALEVTDKGLVVEDKNGTRLVAADTVIYAIGQSPMRKEGIALHDCAPEFYQIGDCLTSKNVYEATSVAYQIATDIGRI